MKQTEESIEKSAGTSIGPLTIQNTSLQHERAVSVCIVLPTYNEAANITHILDRIFDQQTVHGSSHIQLSVLVVDDNSPDGTADLAREYGRKNEAVHLLSREEKDGLGAAYIAGFQHAIHTLHPDILMEMDADGQHNPSDIFRLVTRIGADADFVIGSRYIPGGSVPQTWSAHRKLISRAANRYTKMLLNTGGAKDCTGGFRAIKASTLLKIDFAQLQVKGYAFQVTLLDACVRNGAMIQEVPIAFLERERGESKMRPKDMILGALMIANIRIHRLLHGHNHKDTRSTHMTRTRATHKSSAKLSANS
ncbi:TPA: polyprenol monophosphomannose synthase [Candidatus Woesearchaeota archaeon]|nr:polyprenol monophosphomannose synthase [Candidatus Woesearchaeota archaeon]